MTRYDDYVQQQADFATGVRWLTAEGPALVTRAMLAQLNAASLPGCYVSDYLLGKLTDALRKLPAKPLEPNVASIWGTPQNLETLWNQWQKPPASAEPEPEQPYNNTRLPRTGPLREAALLLHRRHSAAHALMAAATTPRETRATLAREIMTEIIPALDAIYDRLRAGHTDLPPQRDEAEQRSDLKRLLSLRSRVSTIRKHLQTADGERRTQLEKELAAKQEAIKKIENP